MRSPEELKLQLSRAHVSAEIHALRFPINVKAKLQLSRAHVSAEMAWLLSFWPQPCATSIEPRSRERGNLDMRRFDGRGAVTSIEPRSRERGNSPSTTPNARTGPDFN